MEKEDPKPSPIIHAMYWFLGIAFVILVIGFAGSCYLSYKLWNPPPSHFQDLDQLSEETKGMSGLYFSEPIDHVYIFREHRIFGDTYLRYHFLRAEDLKKYYKGEGQTPQEENDHAITWENTTDAPEAIRSWWVRKNQPDCELSGTTDRYEVYDTANNIVYEYRSGG